MLASTRRHLMVGSLCLYAVFEAVWSIVPFRAVWGSAGVPFALVLTIAKVVAVVLAFVLWQRDPDGFAAPVPRRLGRTILLRYGSVVVVSVLVLYLRASLGPAFEQRPLLILFILPIILCALLGGVGPGLVATLILALGTNYLFIPPRGRLMIATFADSVQWILLVLDGVLVSVLSGWLRRSRGRAQTALRALARANDRLTLSEAGLRTVFDASPAALCVSRIGGGVVDANPAFLSLFGLTRADAAGRSVAALCGNDALDQDERLQVELTLKRGGVPFRALVSSRVIPLFGESHRLTVVIDTSRERDASDALYRSEQQFRLLVEAVTDLAFFLLDVNGNVLSWSIGSQGIKGYTADEIVGQSFECFYVDEDRAAGLPQRLLDEAAHKGRVVNEGWRLRRDGSRFWGRATLYAVNGDGGALLGFAKITRDLTLERAASRELRASEARYAAIVDSAMDAIVAIDASRHIVLFNAAAESMFGWSEAQACGRDLEFLLPSAVQDGRRDVFAVIGRDGKEGGGAGEMYGVRANSETFPLEISLARLENEGGVAYTIILRDISARRRADIALERHMRQLESLQEMNQFILAVEDPRQVAQLGLRHLRGWVPFWGATAMVFDWEKRTATVLAVERSEGSRYDPGQHLTLENYGLDDLERMRLGEACRVLDLGALENRSPVLERLFQQGMRSYLRLPLLAEDTLLGALNLASNVAGAFDTVEQQEAEAIAHQLAIMLRQVILRHRVERLSHVYAVLSGINALIVRCHEREALFEGVCQIAVDAGAFRMAWVGVVDPTTRLGRVVACYGGAAGYRDKIELDANADSPYRLRPSCQAARRGEIVLCNDIAADASLAELWPDFLHGGLRAVACLPIVVADEVVAVLALFAGEVGAFDSVEVPLLDELAGDIGFALDHIRKEEELAYLAYYDVLTSLANRSLFLERLVQALASTTREGRRCALVLVDIEHFKFVNDVYGRRLGDDALRQVAARLARHVDSAALLARLGADQFATVVLTASSDDEVVRGVEGLLRNCLDVPFTLGGNELRLSAKFGVAMFPGDGYDAESLLENAEAALKKAKTIGERFLFYRQEMTERAVASLALENQLRQALARHEFLLYYQPKVDAASREVVGVEALLRWRSPHAGLVEPSRFIPMLEETGLILDVGAWALGQAAEDRQAWLLAGLAAPRVAVNVSAVQLGRRDFVETLRRVLAPFGDDAGVDIEITESLIMRDIEQSIESLRAVRACGIRIAIDDFGTGYSSLAYLARLPVQALKIDRSFVNAMLDDADAMTLVAAIISLAHSLRMEVVAEGVETEAQAVALAGLGCETMQGYHFSRPVPCERLGAMLTP